MAREASLHACFFVVQAGNMQGTEVPSVHMQWNLNFKEQIQVRGTSVWSSQDFKSTLEYGRIRGPPRCFAASILLEILYAIIASPFRHSAQWLWLSLENEPATGISLHQTFTEVCANHLLR
ncbi:hypothetical protein D5086_004478 [Populus alba]|uniref:Uncharacterized protein n=1 Tax=Populus alba TaxID=43335 RepID=A0ACC4CQI3_POPAL